MLPAGSAGITRRSPSSNVEIENIGSPGKAGFTQWIVSKVITKNFKFLGHSDRNTYSEKTYFNMIIFEKAV